jgi:glutamate synthase (NADPH/NADH) small chain
VNALRAEAEETAGVENAVDFIAALRQASDLSSLEIGRRVVVIGGGMTAIDAAIQAKLLGAEEVTICYRRGKEQMNASEFEQDLAASKGVTIRHWLAPKRVVAQFGKVAGIELEYTAETEGRLAGTGRTLFIEADQVFKAIGQSFEPGALNGSGAAIAIENGRIRVDPEGRTTMPGVWAGGDCILGGDDLTVSAAAQGRDAAESIHRTLQR